MMKRLFCILLSLVMLMSVSFALAEDTADAAAEAETAEVISDEPVLLVTVNGQEIQSDNDYLLYMQSNYLNWANSNGYDTSDASLITAVNQQSLYDTIGYFLVLQKGKELGLDQFTDDEKSAFDEEGEMNLFKKKRTPLMRTRRLPVPMRKLSCFLTMVMTKPATSRNTVIRLSITQSISV